MPTNQGSRPPLRRLYIIVGQAGAGRNVAMQAFHRAKTPLEWTKFLPDFSQSGHAQKAQRAEPQLAQVIEKFARAGVKQLAIEIDFQLAMRPDLKGLSLFEDDPPMWDHSEAIKEAIERNTERVVKMISATLEWAEKVSAVVITCSDLKELGRRYTEEKVYHPWSPTPHPDTRLMDEILRCDKSATEQIVDNLRRVGAPLELIQIDTSRSILPAGNMSQTLDNWLALKVRSLFPEEFVAEYLKQVDTPFFKQTFEPIAQQKATSKDKRPVVLVGPPGAGKGYAAWLLYRAMFIGSEFEKVPNSGVMHRIDCRRDARNDLSSLGTALELAERGLFLLENFESLRPEMVEGLFHKFTTMKDEDKPLLVLSSTWEKEEWNEATRKKIEELIAQENIIRVPGIVGQVNNRIDEGSKLFKEKSEKFKQVFRYDGRIEMSQDLIDAVFVGERGIDIPSNFSEIEQVLLRAYRFNFGNKEMMKLTEEEEEKCRLSFLDKERFQYLQSLQREEFLEKCNFAFEPIVNPKNPLEVIAGEVLLRGPGGERYFDLEKSLGKFLSCADSQALIISLLRKILSDATDREKTSGGKEPGGDALGWLRQFRNRPRYLTFNVSWEGLQSRKVVDNLVSLRKLLNQSLGMELVVELSERREGDLSSYRQNLRELIDNGISLCADDFGDQSQTAPRLTKLSDEGIPVMMVKLDGQKVKDIVGKYLRVLHCPQQDVRASKAPKTLTDVLDALRAYYLQADKPDFFVLEYCEDINWARLFTLLDIPNLYAQGYYYKWVLKEIEADCHKHYVSHFKKLTG